MTDPATVTIGDDQHRLGAFKAYKAVHVAAIVASISDKVQELVKAWQDYDREYRRNNKIRVPEEVAATRGWTVDDRLWKADDAGGRYLELPAVPTDEERWLNVFGRAFQLARTEVTRAIALVVVADRDLERAEDEGPAAIDDLLDQTGRDLLRRATIGQTIALVARAIDVIKSELAAAEDDLGKIRRLWLQAPPEAQDQEEGEEGEAPTPSSPGSSTSSAPRTEDGDEPTSSTEPAIATSNA